MEAAIRSALKSQLLAALATLKQCLVGCPPEQFQAAHGDYPFSQVLFHTLFYCDFYLAASEADFYAQDFHAQNLKFFADYEELQDRLPVRLYERDFLERYLTHCRGKIETVLDSLDAEALLADSKVRKNPISRLELLIDLCRHIQHHAAQLGLRLQQLSGRELYWITSGWKEFPLTGNA